MKIGTIKWFDATKGFGFIIPKDGGPDIYVRAKVLQKINLELIVPGTIVQFTVATRGGKVFAEEIEVISVAPDLPETKAPEKSSTAPGHQLLEDEDAFEREWGLRRA